MFLSKNPYVKIERLPCSFIEGILPHYSVKEQPGRKHKKQKKFAENEKQLKFAMRKKISGIFAKQDGKTVPPKRSAKQKFNLENVYDSETGDSDDYESSGTGDSDDYESSETGDSDDYESSGTGDSGDYEKDSYYRQTSDYEARTYSKPDKRKLKQEKIGKPDGRKGKRQKIEVVEELTDYEKMVLKNKNEKLAFLESLKINEAKESFVEAVKDFKAAVKPLKPHNQQPKPDPRPKIARSSKVKIDLSERALVFRARSEADAALMMEKKETRRPLPKRVYLNFVLRSDQSFKSFLKDFTDLDEGCTEPLNDYESRFNDMELLTSNIHTFTSEITALDIHPMREKVIIAAGGRTGTIYLWNMTADSEPYAFELHNLGIANLKFCPENPHLLMCCGKDGLLRRGDLVSNIYYKVTDYKNCTSFDFLDPDTYLVSHRDGFVSVADMRTSQIKDQYGETPHKCSDHPLKSVSVHPLNKYEFITPGHGSVRLWDLRNLKVKPVQEVRHLSKRNLPLASAIYSPLTGKSVLTSSSHGQICRSDTSRWGERSLLMFKMKLRFDAPIFATWQPRSDNVFAVGSKLNPRSMDIYNRCNKLSNYSHNCLKAAIRVSCFHPSLPMIAAVGCTQVYPFADKNLHMSTL